jgi:aminoglycoside phosphotransferase (APT) family kinase protein
MLFGTDAGGPPITVVDWGSPAHGMPITDLSYFCGAGVLIDDRRTHERDLVAAYADALGAYDVDVDRDWLWEQYRREAFHGLFITAMTSQMVTMNDRSMDMFGAMASRHLQHALDLDALSLV